MKLRIKKKCFESITIEEIREIEKKFSFQLPKEYIDFILKHNACRTYHDIFTFKFPDEFDEGVFHIEKTYLTSIVNLKSVLEYGLYEDENNKDRKYLDIADIDGSQLIFLSLNKETYGQIYYADLTHDGRYIPIANNLEEFLNSFEENPDYIGFDYEED